MLLTLYATVYALTFNLFFTSIFLKDRQTFTAYHDPSELLLRFLKENICNISGSRRSPKTAKKINR